ncbi:restriction endonuclease family protein [Lyngbya aestuarii BL J]|uniref:Restriction endonuclease family protein n=1 Tax=Lyngbya aestuarii BL J TaxID=1348334 RepID=U7Q9G0_9CYAN|nr:Uma2 family endonuclease [Lyngbya aestuarii]ERT04444.1 restriction endonuclease family protein [Lyngbya aestuarii BL J]
MTAYTINFSSVCQMSDEQFYQLCRNNPDIKFERNATGELIVMSPTGGETGNRNIEIAGDFVFWNRQNKLGKLFDSSTCFQLPNGANRSPDIAWINQLRWDQLTPEEKEKFPPIAPDFVLELMSPSDSLKSTQSKMQEYIDNQVKLGWLIERKNRYIEIYRLGKSVERLNSPTTLSGEEVLPGFVLNLKIVWG